MPSELSQLQTVPLDLLNKARQIASTFPPLINKIRRDFEEQMKTAPLKQVSQAFTRPPGTYGRFDPGSFYGYVAQQPKTPTGQQEIAKDVALQFMGGVGGVTPKAGSKIPVFKGFKDLTTKILERLKGKITTSKQEIFDFTNMPELRQPERELIREALKKYEKKIPVKEFAEKIKRRLLPLKKSGGTTYEMFPWIGKHKYESIVLPDELRGNVRDYAVRLYQSPIRNSAGDIHFSRTGITNYFAHTRIEDIAEPAIRRISGRPVRIMATDTRRIIELQSDLFQKGRLEYEFAGQRPDRGYLVEEARRRGLSENQIQTMLKDIDIKPISKEYQQLEPYRNTWHERIIKEEVKQAAIDGKTKLQFPTGETAMKIEGLGGREIDNPWILTSRVGEVDRMFARGGREAVNELALKANELKVGQEIKRVGIGGEWIITDVLGDGKFKAVPKEKLNIPLSIRLGSQLRAEGFETLGDLPKAKREKFIKDQIEGFTETFDISGKIDTSNPIYRFYNKIVGSFLKNRYDAKQVIDPQGVSWWELNIKPEQANLPIEAFGIMPLLNLLKRKEREEQESPTLQRMKERIKNY